MSKNKNISKRYKVGPIIQTRDNYISKNNYFKPSHPNPNDLYRKTCVVSTNQKDELVLVIFTTKNRALNKGSISDYVIVFDNEGNPIKVDYIKFIVNRRKFLSKREVDMICKYVYVDSPKSKRNKALTHKYNKQRNKK